MEIYFNRGANEALMTALTKVKEQGMLLIELSDEKGHSNRELAAILKYESRVSTLLKELEKQGVAYHEIRRTTIVKTKGKEYDEHAYFIGPKNPTTHQERLDVFRFIFQECTRSCGSDSQEKFLTSEYVNNLIKKVGFLPVYNIIKNNLNEVSFKKSASKALLNQPAVIDEYRNQPRILSELSKSVDKSTLVYSKFNGLIDILPSFDLLNAVEFYRKTINNEYSKLYRNVALKEFTDYDVFLSPLTSYPKYDPMAILLRKPFERIYNEAFILSESDRKIFVKRAHAVYSHFEEILISFIDATRLWISQNRKWNSIN